MDDPRDDSVLDPISTPTVWEMVAQLRAEVGALRADVARLREDNLGLRQQVGYWKARHAAAIERLEASDQERDQLRGQVRQLQADQFGRPSERRSALDRSNELDDARGGRPPRPRGQQPHRPGPSRRDYAHLPVREEWVELPETDRHCPCCGQPLTGCGTEDSEQVEFRTEVYRRVIHRRRYRRTCDCPGPQTRTAPPPAQLIPKSRFGTTVWVEVLLDKFATHRPTERLLPAWAFLDFGVAGGTITDGLRRLQPLLEGLYQALRERNGLSTLFPADETRWKVFEVPDGKTGHVWWPWVFVGPDTTVYVLDVSRSHETPDAHLGDAEGVLVVDRYSASKALPGVKDGRLTLAFCWAHVRRDFIRVGKGWPERKAWALTWVGRIRTLYRLNRDRSAAPTDSTRQMALRDAVAGMRRECPAELADPGLGVPARKVLTSLDEHWAGLTRFVDDPRIPLDNNRSGRCLRGPALGRKNYYGSVAQWSGHLAAMMFTLLGTLPMWRINPRRWLTWYLESCARAGGKVPPDATTFLPWNITPEKLRELRREPAPGRDTS